MIKLKKGIANVTGLAVLCSLLLTLVANAITTAPAYAATLSIVKSGGWNESAYIEWSPVSNAQGYSVFVKPANAADSQYVQLDNQLIRRYPSVWRADAVGLAAGQYVMKAEATLSGGSKVSAVSNTLTVSSYDRSGFAFSSNSQYGTGSGAYNNNGTLKNGAQVIYVTSDTADSVTLNVKVNSSGSLQTGVGIGEILELRQKGHDTTPLAIRFIGKVTAADMNGQLNSSGYLQVKGKNNYSEMNITLEGIGEDAYAYGWGLLLRYVGNVEVRNLGLMLFPDDGISLDTGNVNVWLHNNDLFYGAAGSDADQEKGDGSTDLKKGSTYITLSYNHYWDSGKVSLVGLSESAEFFVTLHHNWFDHSDSRHPRIRLASAHIYNNYYDGISKYGVGMTSGGSAFVESNYFRNTKYPMMISRQGTDTIGAGTFSNENGGMIKAYNNLIINPQSLIYANSNTGTASAHATSFDAYLASSRNEIVPSSYKALVGGTAYNNFDRNVDTGVPASKVDAVQNVQQIVTQQAGRMNKGDFTWTFNNAVDDTSYAVNSALMTKIVNYTSSLVSVGGNSSNGPTPTATPSPTASPSPTATPLPTASPSPTATPSPGAGQYTHNFTTQGTSSSFFTITGNLSTGKGTVVYNGLTLTQCLKIESSTNISFTTTQASTLTLVFNDANGTNIKINGTSYPMNNGIVSVALSAGQHTITKDNVANLFYMQLN